MSESTHHRVSKEMVRMEEATTLLVEHNPVAFYCIQRAGTERTHQFLPTQHTRTLYGRSKIKYFNESIENILTITCDLCARWTNPSALPVCLSRRLRRRVTFSAGVSARRRRCPCIPDSGDVVTPSLGTASAPPPLSRLSGAASVTIDTWEPPPGDTLDALGRSFLLRWSEWRLEICSVDSEELF